MQTFVLLGIPIWKERGALKNYKPNLLGEPTAEDRAVLHARALVRCRLSPRACPHLPTPSPVGTITMLAHSWHLLIENKIVNARSSDQMPGSTLISVLCVEYGWLSPHLWHHLPLWPLVILPLHWSQQRHPCPLTPSTLDLLHVALSLSGVSK